MKRFEYRTLVTKEVDGGEELTKAGVEGWEAYAVRMIPHHSRNMSTTHMFYLKRKKVYEAYEGDLP